MSISDRIYLMLADGTANYNKLVTLVGEPSSSLVPTPSPAVEYTSAIDLDDVATPFDERLAIYGDQPMSTFAILA